MPRRDPKYAAELLAADGKAGDICLRAFDRIQEEINPTNKLIFVILKANVSVLHVYVLI